MERRVMKEVRFYLLAGSIVVLLFLVWFRYRESPPTHWLWVVLFGTFLVSIWLGTRKVRVGGWPHLRRFAALLFLISVVGGIGILCTVPNAAPVEQPALTE